MINCFNESSDNKSSDKNENIKFISEREIEVDLKNIEKMQLKDLRELALDNDILIKLNGKLKTKKQLREELRELYE